MNAVGTIKRVENVSAAEAVPGWHITCEPHVALRLKRVFAKLGKYSREVYALSDSPENARDIDWFMDRFPLDIEPADKKYLAKRAGQHRDQAKLVEELLSRRRELPPFELAVPARAYQKEAAALLLASKGLLLADDVGIGKSCTAICTFCDTRTLPALVVTLTHLPEQWRQQIEMFAPKLRAAILQKTTPYDVRFCTGRHAFEKTTERCRKCGLRREDVELVASGLLKPHLPDVIITSYSKLGTWAETLAPLVRSVVYDEAQELRHATKGNGVPTQKYAGAALVSRSTTFRMGLTATPIFNYGSEIHSVLDVIRPDALGTFDEFKTEWCGFSHTSGQASLRDPKAFGTYARESGIILRRTRAEVGRELPALTRVVQHVDADMTALDHVGSACAELAKFILGLGPNPLKSSPEAAKKGEQMLASAEFDNKIRQATGIAKAPFVAEFVRLLVESGEKVLLFGWHRAVYDIWLDRLSDLQPVMYTGTESSTEKEKSKASFLWGQSKVLIMSLRSGAGLDGLQEACRTIVFGEPDWSPGVHEQCEGRPLRDGQRDPVVAYYLMADVGSDPIVADVLGIKGQQIHGLRDPNAELVEKLDRSGDHTKRLAEAYLRQRAERRGVEAA